MRRVGERGSGEVWAAIRGRGRVADRGHQTANICAISIPFLFKMHNAWLLRSVFACSPTALFLLPLIPCQTSPTLSSLLPLTLTSSTDHMSPVPTHPVPVAPPANCKHQSRWALASVQTDPVPIAPIAVTRRGNMHLIRQLAPPMQRHGQQGEPGASGSPCGLQCQVDHEGRAALRLGRAALKVYSVRWILSAGQPLGWVGQPLRFTVSGGC